MLARLGEYLRERTLLVVLDNCEHLVDACARLVDGLLRSCPGLQVLATSREPLGITGEVAWRVAPLPVSPPEDLPPLAELAAHDAIRLFVDRATAASREFGLVAANAPAVARVCWRLDGIPLAIELAAARVGAVSAEQIAARLDDRFHLLTGGSRAALPRQQTLRATIDWSHALLTEPERVALRRLAVFTGGCTLEAGEAVCAGAPTNDDAVAPDDVLDLLAQLVRKSLVLADGEGTDVRYRLLETIRQYAWEKLREAGEEAAVRRRHRDWYTAWAERWWPELLRHDQARWSARFAVDHDNFRAALEWCRTEAGDGSGRRAPAVGALAVQAADAELRLAGALGRFWLWRGHWHESVAWLEDALARARPGPSAARALALNWAGWLATVTGAVGDGQAQLEESAAMAGRVGDWTVRSLALRHLAMLADALGEDDRQEVLLRDALVSARRSGSGARSPGACCRWPRSRSFEVTWRRPSDSRARASWRDAGPATGAPSPTRCCKWARWRRRAGGTSRRPLCCGTRCRPRSRSAIRPASRRHIAYSAIWRGPRETSRPPSRRTPRAWPSRATPEWESRQRGPCSAAPGSAPLAARSSARRGSSAPPTRGRRGRRRSASRGSSGGPTAPRSPATWPPAGPPSGRPGSPPPSPTGRRRRSRRRWRTRWRTRPSLRPGARPVAPTPRVRCRPGSVRSPV